MIEISQRLSIDSAKSREHLIIYIFTIRDFRWRKPGRTFHFRFHSGFIKELLYPLSWGFCEKGWLVIGPFESKYRKFKDGE